MSPVGTSQCARLINVAPNTLRRWLREKLVGEPRVMLKNGAGVVCLREFDDREVEALKRFAARYRAEVRARRRRPRNYKLDPKVKAARKAMRKEIRNTEKLLHVVEWFKSHELSQNVYRAWMDAEKMLRAAQLLDGDGKLVPNALEGLRAKLAALKAKYGASLAKPKPSSMRAVLPEEAALNLRLGGGRGSVIRGGTR